MSARKPTTCGASIRRAWWPRRRWAHFLLSVTVDQHSDGRRCSWWCYWLFKVDWSQYIAVSSATAHPHYDSEGATYNMGNSYGKSGNHPTLTALSQSDSTFMSNMNLYNIVCCWAYSGFFYNIIRVPPPDVQSAKKDCADLTGAEVICSIPADEPRKPSYYHSFGKMLPLRAGRVLYVLRQGTFDGDAQTGCILHRQSVTFFMLLLIVNLNSFFYPASLCQSQLPCLSAQFSLFSSL